MAADATILGRGGRFGLAAIRLIAAGLFALFVLNLMAVAVDAKPSPGSYQNGFTAACRNHGGTPKRVRTRVVKCTLPDGSTITCDFNVDPPACESKPASLVGAAGGAAVSNVDGVLTEGEPATSDPGTHVGGVRPSGGTIVLITDDDQP